MDNNLDEIDMAISQMDVAVFFNETDRSLLEDEMNQTISQMDMSVFDPNHNPEQQMENAVDVGYEIIETEDGIDDDDDIMYVETSDGEFDEDIPIELLRQYEDAKGKVLPNKSASRYLQAYEVFLKWQEGKRTKSFDEKVIFCYFTEAAEKFKPPTLWSMYSMLKKTFIVKQNVDISKYCLLKAFLKTQCDGYEGRKSNVFEPQEVQKFMAKAPNQIYLAMKAVTAFGVIGGCRGDELTYLSTDYVKDKDGEILVRIPNTKTKKPKFFSIDGQFAGIVREYMKLRPADAQSKRFFLQYRNGKCTKQNMGKNSIAKIPKEIAKWLGLPDSNSYTGHGFRRTSTTILADTGVGIETLKRHGPWKSAAVCEGYIQTSKKYKRRIGSLISDSINLPSTSAQAESLASKHNFIDPVFDVSSASGSAMSRSISGGGYSGGVSDEASGSGILRSISGGGSSRGVSDEVSGSGMSRSISGGGSSRGVSDDASGSGILRSISDGGSSRGVCDNASGSGMSGSISGCGSSRGVSDMASGSGMSRSISGDDISRGVLDGMSVLKNINLPGHKGNTIIYFGGQITTLNVNMKD